MAYLDFPATGGGAAVLDRPAAPPRHFQRIGKPAELTPLEWQVVALAQRDKLTSIRPAGRVTRAIRWLFGLRVSNALSDDRLEALRRIAVLSWYRGFAVASAEVRAFLAAGFTPDQYELLLERISAARAPLPRQFRR
ncbi:MAG: hypothetical protein J0I47_00055 [Sphingomonas sp.]|uniref:hypothetical protein n=1 Tax=Sphingomonas sp. TaxID=28214 RepID=UPI001AC0BBE0|nr:hypothetical protein [Sphingomonas sp.]MBN8806620.1 hypothetical protein [Sphingomonas sp.]